MANTIKKPVKNKVAKVPVIIQMASLECGAAALAMILAYYDRWVSLEQLRIDCDVSRDGSKISNILAAATNHGLESHAYKADAEELKTEVCFPCILFWDNNHFVVLDGFRRNKAVINDPASGKIVVPWEDFKRQYSGIVMTFSPTNSFEPAGKKKSIWDFARKRLDGSGLLITFVILTTLIASLLSIVNPVFSRIFVDNLLSGKNPDWLIPFVVVLSIFTFVSLFFQWFTIKNNLRIQGKMESVGNISYLWHVLRLPVQFFEQRFIGDIAGRQAANGVIAYSIVNIIAPFVISIIMTILYLFIMLRYSVLLTAIGLGSVLLNYLVSIYITQKRINITKVKMREEANLSGYTVGGINSIETIKASGSEKGFFKKWAGYQAAVNAETVKYDRINQYFGSIPTFLTSLSNVVVLVIGVLLVLQGQFTLGMIMAFQGFLTSFLTPATQLISASQTMQETITQVERIDDVMNYPVDDVFNQDSTSDSSVSSKTVDKLSNSSFCRLKGAIELKNVSFSFSKISKPILENISLTISPNQIIAIVGKSGCGKSTLSKLLSGVYQPCSGQILYDGEPMANINRQLFIDSVSVVDQDIVLFEDTISNNISMWNDYIEDFEVIIGANDACIHDDIMKMQGGYQYKIREDGTNLSGGQRQRIEIARALAKDPSICILDEATSALDSKTELNVINAIKSRNITCIIIAHRLSTIRHCDEIIVLDEGKIVEKGSHDELYKLGGFYTDLVTNE